MPDTLAGDPFGAAMLGAAGLALLSLLLLLVARVRGRSQAAGAYLLAIALLGFLGAAVAGTAERVEQARGRRAAQARSPAPPEAKANEDDAVPGAGAPSGALEGAGSGEQANPEPAIEEGAGTGAVDAAGAAGTEEPTRPEDLLADMAAAAAEEDWLRVGLRYRALRSLEPSPEGLDEAWRKLRKGRRAAVMAWIREAHKIANGPCDDAEAVLRSWSKLRTIDPSEALYRPARKAAARLERCRGKLERKTALVIRSERTAKRVAFAEEVAERLADAPGRVRTRASGPGKVRLRVAPLPEDRAKALVDGGFLQEATDKGFTTVTFSDGKRSTTHDLEPASDLDLARARLHELGLQERLELP